MEILLHYAQSNKHSNMQITNCCMLLPSRPTHLSIINIRYIILLLHLFYIIIIIIITNGLLMN